MDYKELIERLNEWNENLISELCADDILTCDDLCGCTGDCIVMQAIKAITDLLTEVENGEARCEMFESANRALSTRITTAEKMVKEYQDVIVPGYRERAEKAEAERDAYKEMIYKERPCAFCDGYTGNWNPECIKCDRNTKEYRPKFRLREPKGE